MQYKQVIEQVFNQVKDVPVYGKLATYIPELAKIDATKFGVHFRTNKGFEGGQGDFEEKFSIQSIAKVYGLLMAYQEVGSELWKRVDVEPSGTSYNSLILLELENGIPRNPFINAGAIVIADVLVSVLDHPEEQFIEFVRQICGNQTLDYDLQIAKSEKEVANRNYSLIHLMKSQGNIRNDIERVMDFYCTLCSICMTCAELTESFSVFSNGGIHPRTGKMVIKANTCKRMNAIMQLCGFYDEAGEFAYRVGLPGKSGVGGGIVAVQPGVYSICVWSPLLNKKGNSTKGMLFLEEFTSLLQESIF